MSMVLCRPSFHAAVVLIVAILLCHEATAFLRPTPLFPGGSAQPLRKLLSLKPTLTRRHALVIDKFLNFDKEKNRKFRRTVFDRQDWKRHRSSDRYIKELMNMPSSLVLRGLSVQALGVSTWAFAVIVYNFLVKRNPWNAKFVPPLLSIPALPLRLLSPSLGLLLVFRTNKAYERWREGRIAWSGVDAKIFDVIRQSLQWCTDKARIASCTRYLIAYTRCLKWHLGHQDNERRLREDLKDILTGAELETLMDSNFKVQHTLSQISHDVVAMGMPPNLQVHIDKSIIDLSAAYFNCDRIYTTPIPVSYTRHTARFLLMFLMTLPIALYSEFSQGEKLIGTLMIPVITFMSSIFLFAIEELGVQIEEPFGILPLARICSMSYYGARDMLGDQGIDWFAGTAIVSDEEINQSVQSGDDSSRVGEGLNPTKNTGKEVGSTVEVSSSSIMTGKEKRLAEGAQAGLDSSLKVANEVASFESVLTFRANSTKLDQPELQESNQALTAAGVTK